ncbi:hypothetical protein ACHQM5_015651 [Ranunculus cassubicifolius]
MNHRLKLILWTSVFIQHGTFCQDMMTGKSPAKSHSTMSRSNHLPDINQEPPASLAAAEEPVNMDLSTSRTESLDAEHLRFDSSPSPQQQKSDDPSSRWVKRLKLSSPGYNYAHGTKLDTLHNNKLKDTTSPSSSNPMELDKQPDSSEGVSLSHPWIQRWCRNQEPRGEMKMKMELSERESSKMEMSEYQTKQFPSIAAMALMGKTMTGLQSCKIQNKGTFVVWDEGGYSE